ncbi:MAG: hypothetical protein M1343_06910 [Chloroflexi bacterium]|nr:hypothetical protein [Chloroflexota bacterium]MDA8189770.1 hypothetical protein [Dehalococcoidales bacterium]
MPLPEMPADKETKANNVLGSLLLGLTTVQASYQHQHGRFWQGLRTHAVTPADGKAATPDTTRKPTDEAEDWVAAGVALPASMEVAIRVDTYEGPEGQGYVVIGEIEIGSRLLRRCVNVGPEVYRAHDWVDVTPMDYVPTAAGKSLLARIRDILAR